MAETSYLEDSKERDSEEYQTGRDCGHREFFGFKGLSTLTSMILKLASRSFILKKAPGADGVTADICLHAVEYDPDLFLYLLNKHLHHFPTPWKETTVVFLWKPGKATYTNPRSYRPIGLLSVLGKILEKSLSPG
ncbi:unnamed protein product [Euphydryas editha]|uniref:Reverse transcriptase n=1 Tax=Euphydryas editha TaxID=104508 RepID=A0AAU9TWX9_EUPED|nr:unnamed protein product [Euphydryas editha]